MLCDLFSCMYAQTSTICELIEKFGALVRLA